jgi:RNase H-like domain found in reverse transcriptase
MRMTCPPVMIVSRNLKPTERKYSTHDRKPFSIHHTIWELRCYLHGYNFTVRSDHYQNRYLDAKKHLSKRQIRWLDGLAEYEYHTEHIKGMWKRISNDLSRRAYMEAELYIREYDDMSAISLSAISIIDRPRGK